MKNKSIARSNYFRVSLGLVVFFAGVLLAVLGFGSFGSVLAQATVSVPGSIKGNETAVTVRYTYGRVPMQGEGSTHTLTADRPAKVTLPTAVGRRTQSAQPQTNPWRLQATLSGVVTDLAFPSATVGYAAAELGRVWKTTDGGETWNSIMDLGFPYYWYGVHALSEEDVVVSGFDNSNFRGLLRWSHDGGQTWEPEIVIMTDGWSTRVRFADVMNGLVMDLLSLSQPNAAHYTTNGGQVADDWTQLTPDPNGGWLVTSLASYQALGLARPVSPTATAPTVAPHGAAARLLMRSSMVPRSSSTIPQAGWVVDPSRLKFVAGCIVAPTAV
jgi:hypothetical protein